MADYPSYTSIPQSARSSVVDLGRANIIDLAEDNTIRGANFASVYPVQFTIVHEHRPLADYDTIIAHFDGEGATAFNFVWSKDLATYTVRYGGQRPQYEIIAGALEVDIVVVLIGVKS